VCCTTAKRHLVELGAGPCGYRPRRSNGWKNVDLVRIVFGVASNAVAPLPDEVRTHPAPVPYKKSSFRPLSNGVEGRCSLCLRDARTMIDTAGKRWLALCDIHDRQHRWVRDPGRHGLWYLAPLNRAGRDGWWHIAYSDAGFAGGEPGWYAREFDGERLIDLRARTVHRARVNAERVLTLPIVVAHRRWTTEDG
jgi:hypothetical protein